MKNKDNIFSKNSYDSQLEELLDSKNFSDEVKSLILNIVYKIDNAYRDYSKIKYDAKQKNEIIAEITNIIQNYCDTIEIINPTSKKSRYYVDKNAKRIKTFPNENPLLQALYYISTEEAEEIDDVINKVVTKIVNKGRAIDGTEIIRDFNGWSWNNAIEDNMNKLYNLVYQDLAILLGSNGVVGAVNSGNVAQSIEVQLREKYGDRKASEIVKRFEICCFLIYMRNSDSRKKEMLDYSEKLERKLKIVNNKPEYISIITKKNNENLKIVAQIENILKNEKLLQKKYLKPEIKNKYKMIDNYRKYLVTTQKQRMNQISKNSNLLTPAEYLNTKNRLEINIDLLSYIKRIYTKRDSLYSCIIDLQRLVTSCLYKKIETFDQRKDLVNAVYEVRYFNYLPVKNDKKIKDIKELDVDLRNVKKKIISKLLEEKIIEKISKDEDSNYQILKYIFNTKTTNMNKIFVKLRYRDKKLYLEYYDEDAVEIEADINFSQDEFNELSKKVDKKIKIFI